MCCRGAHAASANKHPSTLLRMNTVFRAKKKTHSRSINDRISPSGLFTGSWPQKSAGNEGDDTRAFERAARSVKGALSRGRAAWNARPKNGVSHSGQRSEDLFGVRDPAENAALGFDHPQAHLVKLGKIGSAAITGHDALETAIIGFTHGGVHAHFGRDSAHDEALDALVQQNRIQLRRVKRDFAGL